MSNAIVRAIWVAGLSAAMGACGGSGGQTAGPGAAPGTGAAATGAAAGGAAAGRVAALDHEIARLQAEAARLDDVSEIERLQRAYGYYLDAADWDQAADLFADDGSIEIGLDGVYSGKARIREYLRALGGGRAGLRQGELHEVMQLQPVIDVATDGLTAKGRWRAFVMIGQFRKTALWGEGPYENQYVKENGVWKIQSLHWYQTFMVPYAGGWAQNKDVNQGIYVSRKLPPDRPPTERYETWPGVYIPPYHYRNPVTAAGAAFAPQAGSPTTEASTDADRTDADSTDADHAVANLHATVDRLAQRIERLKDEDQIENLISIYGYYLDKREWDQLADLFADDGTMEISLRGVYVGKPSIRRALVLFGPLYISTNYLHNHMQLQPVIRISSDGTHAWSRTRALSELGTFKQVGIWGDGVYANEYVKQNGVWKIASDHIYTGFFATYDKGWEFAAAGAPRASDKIPPDRPPSVLYDSYPGEYIPPFDYRHPVTGAEIEIPPPLRVRPNTAAAGATAPINAGPPVSEEPAANAGPPPNAAAPVDAGVPLTAQPSASTQAETDAADASLDGQLADARARVEQVEQTVARLEDERAIETLQRTFGYFVDKAMWKEAADLFADDGTLEDGGRGVFLGKARILEYLEWLAPKGLTFGKLQNVMQLQPIVTVAPDGKTAKARWEWLSERGEYRKSAGWGIGTYENEYVKQNGVWKLRTLHAYNRMSTPYAEGWAKVALPNTRPAKDLRPDRPPTTVYRTYPATYVPPYDYPNPVTGK